MGPENFEPALDRELDSSYQQPILEGILKLGDAFASSDLDLAVRANEDLDRTPAINRLINDICTRETQDGKIVHHPSWILELKQPAATTPGTKRARLELTDVDESLPDKPIATADISYNPRTQIIEHYEESFKDETAMDLANMLEATTENWTQRLKKQPWSN